MGRSENIREDIDFFFRKPELGELPPGDHIYSTLFFLRRDLRNCLFSLDECKRRAVIPSAMIIMAGIDLLGKCLDGRDCNTGVGLRFRHYVGEYLDYNNRNELYQLRNSIMHSFGLRSTAKGVDYKFVLIANKGPMIQTVNGNKNEYKVDVLTLNDEFEKSIGKYRTDLKNNKCLRKKFKPIFEKYGTLSTF